MLTRNFVSRFGIAQLGATLLLGLLTALGAAVAPTPAHAQISFVDPGFYAETVATLPPYSPVGLAFAPDGRIFVWQKAGKVRIIKNGQLLTTPFLDISDHVNQYLDHGLLGLALDPNFTTNGYVYLAYVYEGGGNSNDQGPKISRLSRVQANPATPDVALAGETLIIDNIPSEARTHSIDSLRFAADGKLFVTIGDAATDLAVDPLALRAQDLNSLNGKILRINPDGSAPSDNPFYEPADPTSNRSKVWAYGLRNPFRFALHPISGAPYIGDVGWHTWEELNRGRGVNFGWPCFEGPEARPEYQVFAECQELAQPATTAGVYVYDHTVGNSIIAGNFYTGVQYPAPYRGNFFTADYGGGWIERLVFDTNENLVSINPFASNLTGPVALEMGPDGFLYYITLPNGQVGRIRFSGAANTPPVAKASVTPNAGYSPLTITFTSAGSVDPEGGALTYAWDFGDGTSTTAANPTHQYVTPRVTTFTPTLTVTDPGALSTSTTTKVTVGSLPPVATLTTTPSAGTTVHPGDTITYHGSALDPDEGPLPGTALSWQLLLHHDTHVHPLTAGTGATGSFVVPNHGVGTYACEIILTATDSSGLTDTKSVTLPVASTDPPLTHLDFTYANKTALALAGWDFLAKTTMGTTRDTEQTGALAVDYNQTTHPGVLRIPLGSGELWQGLNNSQNILFRTLPTDWTSLRLKITTFNPSANYQQVGLLAYQDDDNYVNVNRLYSNGPQVELFREVGQATTLANRVGLVNAGNLLLRLDRDATTNTYTGYYSVDNGLSWVLIGSTVATLTNPRVGIQTGANLAATTPLVDLAWVEILRPAPPVVSGVTPSTGAEGQTLGSVVISGSDFQSGATCSFGSGITVNSCTFVSATQLTANLTIGAAATLGAHTVTVTNPDTQSGSLANAFSVTVPMPAVSDVTPNAGLQGQTLANVVITGSNFQSGATCSFGSGITVNSCTFTSATQLTTTLTIDANAILGGRTVTVTNPDTQSGSLANAFSVITPTPTVSGITPNAGVQGQTLTNVVITGSNFQSGATCSFGSGITVNSCTFTSATQLTATLTIATTATIGSRTASVTNPDTQIATLPSAFSVTAGASSTTSHFDLTFATSSALRAAGWDFLAKTAAGAPRNTEQVGSGAVDYDQTAHPGVLRIPLSSGEIWQALNNSQNTLFHDLPNNWTSLRLRLAIFNPTANYQQVGLLAYQDDDTYVNLNRPYVNGQQVELFREIGRATTYANRLALANTSNLLLRLDRDASTNTYTGYYSVDNGLSWVLVGSTVAVLSNTRVGIQTGSNPGGARVADVAWVEILQLPPAPTVSGVTPNSGMQGQTLSNVGISGSNFQSGATCNFGSGITVTSCTFTSATQLTATLMVTANAALGSRTVTVTNPDTQTGNLANTFSVTAAPLGPPTITGVTPNTGVQGQAVTGVLVSGSNFQSGATCNFGSGVTVTSCTFTSVTQLTANLTIAATAAIGSRTVSVTNPDTQTATLPSAFSVTPTLSIAPSITSVSPGSGAQGQTLTGVVITGNDFQSGATCSFGTGITVNSCAFNSTTQLTANVTIAANAPVGGRTVTVTNPDAQSGNLTNAFNVAAPSSTAPIVSLLTPNSGIEGQSLTVTITGNNFAPGATCSFGMGVVMNSCLFNSTTQMIASITIAANAVTAPMETRTVLVTNPDTQSGTFQNGFTIVNTSSLVGHFDFTYPDRTSLLADGWGYIAKTASGGTRNTEQTGALAIDYAQTTHPGTIRVPLGSGEIWQTLNSSQNTLFHNLPSDWTSIRLKIASFNPVANYQQVGLIVYQDDDTYVNLERNFNSSSSGSNLDIYKEAGGVTTKGDHRSLINTGNLILRLDRNPATNAYSGYYSVDGGANWIQLTGTLTQALNNPRLAIQVGANLAANTPSADLAWVEIIDPNSLPAPTVSGVTPGACEQGQQCTVTINGANFQSGAACAFGAGITTNSCTFISVSQLTANLTILPTATVGARMVTVLNPDTQTASLVNGFAVTQVTPVTPMISTVDPNAGSQGQNLLVTISGANFQFGATCNFGAGVLVQTCTRNSSTQLTANITVTGVATPGLRTVTVTNPGIQGGSLANAFSVTVGNLPETSTLTVAVLVNSANPTGYSTTPGTPGEFQRYPKLYLDHLQVPYEVIDTATTPPPADLGNRQLILAGHTGLNLSSAWQNAIVNAVNGGTGFVNLDAEPTIGAQVHMQNLFGATGSSTGIPAISLSIPAAVLPGGATPHFITALQRKFLGDPAGDIVYSFHADAHNVVQPVTATVLTTGAGTVLVRLGMDPLIVAQQTATGRAVHFGSYLYLQADRFGFVQGVDDLFWRSLVWAARKPFVLRGYPRHWAVQMDDTTPGWGTRVKDMYNPALTGTTNANGVGGPWKVTGYLFTENFPAGSTERANVISDIQNGKLQVAPHSFTNIAYGDMYWHAVTGGTPRELTDNEWTDNLTTILAWKQGNGGADAIPSFSRSLVAHFWDLSNNTGYDLWNTLGFRYVTSVQKPGFQRPATPQTVNVYNGAERLHVKEFWPYELPPKLDPSESTPFFFANDYVVGSRVGLPSQPFFLFATQYIDLTKYPRNDFIWPSTTYGLSPAASTDYLERYTWRHWSGMSPVQLFTHDIVNYELATPAERQAVIQQASTWLNANGARHVFMENLGDYIYARTKSVLVDAIQTTGGLQVTLTGNAMTPDGAPVATQFLVFYPDAEGVPVTVSGFAGGTTAAMPLPSPPPTVNTVSPNSGLSTGGSTVILNGTNLSGVQQVLFGSTPAAFSITSATTLTVTTPAGSGVVDVTVESPAGAATLTNGFTYVAPPPLTGHFDFTYANSTALKAATWDFLARTTSGVARNTEQSGSGAVDYNQTTHPGVIRIPLGTGELWQALNNSQNTLFRDLPSTWTSIRLKLATFNPSANYQQVGLLAYQDDDNYVNLNRPHVNGQQIELFREIGQTPTLANRVGLVNTGNLILRLDRNTATNTYTGYYSTDGGTTWTLVGSSVAVLNNPRVGIQTGSNPAGTLLAADLAWVEILP